MIFGSPEVVIMSKLANLKFATLEVSRDDYDLKAQYLTVTKPEVLWQELKDRFENQPDVALMKTIREFLFS